MKQADRQSFEDFVSAESSRLMRIGFVLTGNTHDAWDLSQETLVRVGQVWSRIDSRGSPQGYARQTLLRLYYRRSRRWREVLRGRLPDRDHGESFVEQIGNADLLHRALQRLPPRQRAAVVLRYYLQMTEKEAASAMECTVGNVKSQTSRGLQQLRKELLPEVARQPGSNHDQ